MECKRCGKITPDNGIFYPWPAEIIPSCWECASKWQDFMYSRIEEQEGQALNNKILHFTSGGNLIPVDDVEKILRERDIIFRELMNMQKEFYNMR